MRVFSAMVACVSLTCGATAALGYRPPAPEGFVAPLGSLATTASAAIIAEPRPAERIIADFEGVAFPRIDGAAAQKDREKYFETYNKEMGAQIRLKAGFALELFEGHPTHPRTAGLMDERWSFLLTSQAWDPEAVLHETEDVLSSGRNDELLAHAAYHHARAIGLTTEPRWDVATIMPEIDRLARIAPKDERAADLLTLVARNGVETDDDRVPFWTRIITEHDGSKAAEVAHGQLLRFHTIGKPFSFEFTDAVTGRRVSTAETKGRVVVIDFWATWCGPCIEHMPGWVDFYDRYRDRGVVLIGANGDLPPEQGGRERLLEYVRDNDIPWPQFYIAGSEDPGFATRWGVRLWPTVFVVGPDGALLHSAVGGQAAPAVIERIVGPLLENAPSPK